MLQIWDSSICGTTSRCEDHGFELGSYAGDHLIIWRISSLQFRNLKFSSEFLLRPVWRQDLSSWSCCGLWYHPPLARSTKSWSTYKLVGWLYHFSNQVTEGSLPNDTQVRLGVVVDEPWVPLSNLKTAWNKNRDDIAITSPFDKFDNCEW